MPVVVGRGGSLRHDVACRGGIRVISGVLRRWLYDPEENSASRFRRHGKRGSASGRLVLRDEFCRWRSRARPRARQASRKRRARRRGTAARDLVSSPPVTALSSSAGSAAIAARTASERRQEPEIRLGAERRRSRHILARSPASPSESPSAAEALPRALGTRASADGRMQVAVPSGKGRAPRPEPVRPAARARARRSSPSAASADRAP